MRAGKAEKLFASRAALAGADSVGGEHIGIDEAGRGCLAGPVVAAAVLFPFAYDPAARLPGLTDSKKLDAATRERFAALIAGQARAIGVGLSWQDEIDRVNILNATFRAMSRAVLALAARLSPAPAGALGGAEPVMLPRLLIDGNKVIPQAQWNACAGEPCAGPTVWARGLPLPVTALPSRLPALPEQRALVGGDALVPSISAASVLAKTVRDGLLVELDALYPGYGLARHKGYGTKEHLEALAQHGPCPLHRLSFRRVRPERAAAVQLALF